MIRHLQFKLKSQVQISVLIFAGVGVAKSAPPMIRTDDRPKVLGNSTLMCEDLGEFKSLPTVKVPLLAVDSSNSIFESLELPLLPPINRMPPVLIRVAV
jgi:hypothetical protein